MSQKSLQQASQMSNKEVLNSMIGSVDSGSIIQRKHSTGSLQG